MIQRLLIVSATLAGLGFAIFVCSAATTTKPLCTRFSTFRIQHLNESVSPCDLYFYADRFSRNAGESYFRVVVERGHTIPIRDKEPLSSGGLNPYWYRWVILDDKGKVQRAWLAHFLRNRDGMYHTVVTLSDDEWRHSHLELFFEDVDGDGEREDATYILNVGAIAARP